MVTVLQITDKVDGGGGIWQVVVSHAASLTQHGHDVRRFHLGEPKTSIVLKKRLLPNHPLLKQLTTVAQGADVIHLHLGFLSLSPDFVKSAAQQAALVVNLHDVSPFEFSEIGAGRGLLNRLQRHHLRPIRKAVWKAICDHSDRVISPSRYLADLAQKAGVAKEKTAIIPHSVELEKGDESAARSDVVLYVGLLADHKGCALLLEAFSLLKRAETQLHFIGEGPAKVALQAHARKLGIADRVQFLGHLPHDKVQLEMRRARVLAHPSLVDEGFGLVGIEAMQVGCPVVSFGTGGATDWLIDQKTGIRIYPITAHAFSEGLGRVLNDDALAHRLGQVGRAHVEATYHPDRITALLIQCYEAARSERT